MTDQIPTMTPAELLAPDTYALAYFERGEFRFCVETFSSLIAAQAVAAQHNRRRSKTREYRVIAIAKETSL